jgi:acyl carrier protein
MTDEIEDQLRAYITRVAGLPAPPADDDRLADHGYQASLALLELVAFLEDTFRIEVRPVDLVPAKLATIAQIAAMVRARITASRPPTPRSS